MPNYLLLGDRPVGTTGKHSRPEMKEFPAKDVPEAQDEVRKSGLENTRLFVFLPPPVTEERPKLRAVSLSELQAKPGHFRAVVFIDSDTYQVGEDVPTREEALQLCLVGNYSDPIQIFDDQGKPQRPPAAPDRAATAVQMK